MPEGSRSRGDEDREECEGEKAKVEVKGGLSRPKKEEGKVESEEVGMEESGAAEAKHVCTTRFLTAAGYATRVHSRASRLSVSQLFRRVFPCEGEGRRGEEKTTVANLMMVAEDGNPRPVSRGRLPLRLTGAGWLKIFSPANESRLPFTGWSRAPIEESRFTTTTFQYVLLDIYVPSSKHSRTQMRRTFGGQEISRRGDDAARAGLATESSLTLSGPHFQRPVSCLLLGRQDMREKAHQATS